MQDTTQVIPQTQTADTTHVTVTDSVTSAVTVTSTDTVIRRPKRRMRPLNEDSISSQSPPALAVQKPDSAVTDTQSHSSITTQPPGTSSSPLVTVNFYKGHELIPVHTQPENLQNLSPIWFFPILIFTIGVITWLRVFYSKYFSQIFQALMNNNITNQIVRDENIVVQRASVYLSFTFNLIVAMFLYQVSMYLKWDMGGIGTGIGRFLFFVILVSVAYALKFLVLKVCGLLFDQDREMATYIFNIFLINHMLGILLIPMVALLTYNQLIPASVILIVSLILIAASMIYRLIRGILIGVSVPGFSPLYLFLYLCTLEIAPLTVLVRILVQ